MLDTIQRTSSIPSTGSQSMNKRVFLRKEIRRNQINLDVLKKLAKDDDGSFSDDESDGVESDDDIEIVDTIVVPFQTPKDGLMKKTIKLCKPTLGNGIDPIGKSNDENETDSWTIVDKSPTFENLKLILRIDLYEHAMADRTDSLNLPLQRGILIVQREALLHDEEIRKCVLDAGFNIIDQTVLQLTPEKASIYFHDKLNKPEDAPKKTPVRSPRQSTRGTATSGRRDEGASSAREKTPRGDDASPRPNSPSKTPRDIESPEDAIAALSNGPILVMLVEKQNALKSLMELVGPVNPSLWPQNPTTLRGQYGVDAKQVGVRCSKSPLNVSDEQAFLFAHNGNRESKSGLDNNVEGTHAMVCLDSLLDFLFPPNVQHSNSTGRLFVFSLYGPLDSKSRLRSGEKGLHVVTNIELNTMCASIEREDILSVYGMIGLSREEEEEVLRQADKHMKHIPRYTKPDIETLFQSVSHDKNGRMSFHAMQQKIMQERIRRVLCMKDKLNTSLAPPIVSKFRKSLSHTLTKTKYDVAPPSMFMKDMGLNGSENAVLISKLLNCHCFKICHLDQGNSSDLTQNVRLLREEIIDAGHPTRLPWNSNHAFSHEK